MGPLGHARMPHTIENTSPPFDRSEKRVEHRLGLLRRSILWLSLAELGRDQGSLHGGVLMRWVLEIGLIPRRSPTRSAGSLRGGQHCWCPLTGMALPCCYTRQTSVDDPNRWMGGSGLDNCSPALALRLVSWLHHRCPKPCYGACGWVCRALIPVYLQYRWGRSYRVPDWLTPAKLRRVRGAEPPRNDSGGEDKLLSSNPFWAAMIAPNVSVRPG